MRGIQEASKYLWHHTTSDSVTGKPNEWVPYGRKNSEVLENGFRSGAERVVVQVVCVCVCVCSCLCLCVFVFVCGYDSGPARKGS